MFTMDEVQALVAGARMMEAWGGPVLARHVRSAISKITLALPKNRREEIERTPLFAASFLVPPDAATPLETVRQSMLQRRKLRIDYCDAGQHLSSRTVHPLAVFFWGTAWSLAAWCESRQGFRNFRLDRIRSLEMLAARFEETPGQTLEDFLKRANAAEPENHKSQR